MVVCWACHVVHVQCAARHCRTTALQVRRADASSSEYGGERESRWSSGGGGAKRGRNWKVVRGRLRRVLLRCQSHERTVNSYFFCNQGP